jgi:RNA polymerase sigma-70 factor (ECF subfamily)
MDENELIQRLQLGEESAYEFIFRKHFNGLCLFAEHFLKNKKAAEEIVEDFFCHLWDNCDSISINSSLRGYLYRSVHNRCLKHIRHQKIEQQYLTSHQYYFTDKEILETASDDYPIVNLVTKELEDKISGIIDSLPAQCKSIFRMSRFDNLTYQEIADKLKVSVNTVKTQMTRALQKLRIELKDYLIMLAAILIVCQSLYT